MSKTYNLDQMKLFCDIAAVIAKQAKIPADNRANVVIRAANMIVAAYALTDDEYMEHEANTPITVDLQPTEAQIYEGLKELHANGVQFSASLVGESLEDVLVFTWQSMIGARDK